MAPTAEADHGEYCERCDMYFPTWDALLHHKVSSGKHMACVFCGQEFATIQGCNRHQRQDHAHEQDITCPGCDQHFTRIGAYISHIELKQCTKIRKQDFDNRREEKAAQALRAKETGNDDEELNGPLIFNDPPRMPIDWKAWDADEKKNPVPDTQSREMFPPLANQHYRDGDTKVPDLLTGEPRRAAIPDLLTGPEEVSTWVSGKNLFPDAPKAVAPPTEYLEALTLGKSKENEKAPTHPYDPDQPGFRLGSYYNPASDKYRCAYLSCNKTFKSPSGLYQHLKSPTHSNEKLSCPTCLRLFDSATALVQHAESQAVKCSIRESAEYRGAVDQITGGFVDLAGRHSDNTVRYKATGLPSVEASQVAERHRRFMEEKEAERQRKIEKAKESARW